MRLNIYKDQDMRSEDLLMSFKNVKKGDTLDVTGLASNTVYYMNLVDDEDKEIEFKGKNSFSTMYMPEEEMLQMVKELKKLGLEKNLLPMYMDQETREDYLLGNKENDDIGYRIILEEGGFYLYLGKDKVSEPDGLLYSIGNDLKNASLIDSFPIDISNMVEKEFIVIWKGETAIAYSEALR